MQDIKDIYIIGAGISGLIAAYELEQAGYHPTIIEKSSEVGGRVKTVEESGFSLDLGFQVLLSAYPLANKYLDMSKLDLLRLESGALIFAEDKSYRIGDPLRNWKVLLPSLFADIGTLRDKFKILSLNIKLKQKSLEEIFASKEKTTLKYLEDFGFSGKIIDRFFKPFFAGIFLEPKLTTSSRMFEFVYKMFGEGYATIPRLGIGEISKQLKNKLQQTDFLFDTEVNQVTTDFIESSNGNKIPHQGVIIASQASSMLPTYEHRDTVWKSCWCIYYEVDQTNIPEKTIALVADPDVYANNLYAYRDLNSGKMILSVTSLKQGNDQEIIQSITSEVKKYTDATQVNYIHHFKINQALPDIQDLRMTALPHETKYADNIFLAGDHLYNGSLNAAMESGRLAAMALIEERASFQLGKV